MGTKAVYSRNGWTWKRKNIILTLVNNIPFYLSLHCRCYKKTASFYLATSSVNYMPLLSNQHFNISQLIWVSFPYKLKILSHIQKELQFD